MNDERRKIKSQPAFFSSSCNCLDIVLLKPLPESIKSNEKLLAACVTGAELKDVYLGMIETAGFQDIQVMQKGSMAQEVEVEKKEGEPEVKLIVDGVEIDVEDVDASTEDIKDIGKSIQSVTVTAVKN